MSLQSNWIGCILMMTDGEFLMHFVLLGEFLMHFVLLQVLQTHWVMRSPLQQAHNKSRVYGIEWTNYLQGQARPSYPTRVVIGSIKDVWRITDYMNNNYMKFTYFLTNIDNFLCIFPFTSVLKFLCLNRLECVITKAFFPSFQWTLFEQDEWKMWANGKLFKGLQFNW